MDEKIHLTDLISAETLQRIQDAFSAMTGMAALTTDADGVPVTNGSNFTDFCMKHVRESEDGHIRCEQCDKFGAEDAWKKGNSSFYYCHAGMIDYAAPILADQQMIGSFIGGQVLTAPMEKDNVYQIAWELGIDPQALWDASQKIRILPEKRIDDAAHFLFTVANVLSDMAYGKYCMLQANSEIERANTMKSDFLANMSHEIRTPMNAVIGMAEMALREDLSPTVREYLRQIKISSRALLTIINDILDFSKIESGKMDILPVEYEAMSIINDVANIAVERLKDKEVELILDIAPDIPYLLMGDNIRIKQILLNLVNNAAKFTHEGQVVVHMSQTPLAENRILLRFEIEDTGIGIKESDLENIFKSFQQVDSKRNRNIEGTGLGLAISRQLALLMGGTISVKSEYGKGSTFTIEFPQDVADPRPSCEVKDPETVRVMGLLCNPYVKKNLAADCARFQVSYREISAIQEIAAEEGCSNFLFVEEALFTPNLKEYIQEKPEITTVLLSAFHSGMEEHNIQNLLMVRKPISSINEANIFNHEDMFATKEEKEQEDFHFVAPHAHVLVVDDNPTNLVVTEGLLQPLQMKVDTASSGQEALDKLSVNYYDIIFMDHMMPDLDGIETTHIIRRLHPEFDDVPILALTANAMSGMREMFLQEGMNDFISKPIEVRSLIRKVAMWLPEEKIVKTDGEAQEEAAKETPENTQTLVIADLDTERALKMLGKESLYMAVLKDYYRTIDAKSKRIKELEQQEDWKGYTIEVHSLKSASAQIGAMILSAQAAELEKAGNAEDSLVIHKSTDEMLSKYRDYLTTLAPFCKEEEQEGESLRGEITQEALTELFEELSAAIEELDMDRMEAARQTLGEYSFGDSQKQFFERLSEAVENIDVDACEEIMNDWKAAINS